MIYAYGLRARPFDIGTVPQDYCGFDNSYVNDDRRIRHGLVFYQRQLSDAELKKFELVFLEKHELAEYNWQKESSKG